MSLVINTIIDTIGYTKIYSAFKIGDRYMSTEINEIINKRCNGRYNAYTTTGIFREIFKTEEINEGINGKSVRFYKIIKLK